MQLPLVWEGRGGVQELLISSLPSAYISALAFKTHGIYRQFKLIVSYTFLEMYNINFVLIKSPGEVETLRHCLVPVLQKLPAR